MITENYLDPEVGYLLGLIVARGQVTSGTGSPVVTIEFPHRSLRAKGITKDYDQEHFVEHNLLLIKGRITDILGHLVEHTMRPGCGTIVIRFPGRPMTFRNLEYILGEKFTPRISMIPQSIFNATADIQREFVRGFADCAGFIRPSNADRNKMHRVYFQIPYENWRLPVEFCRLLQTKLGVPIHSIQWGHPNIRTPHAPETHSWSKEHQVRVFAQDFLRVGFHVSYKNEILEELAAANEDGKGSRYCNPNKAVRRVAKKPKRPDEKAEKLPTPVRRHFDAYWQVCLKLGCAQCHEIEGEPTELFGDDE